MAGSLTWRTYTDDQGTNYSVRLDKSNSNATVASTPSSLLMPVRVADYPLLPKGVKIRYVLAYVKDRPTVRRKFYLGNRDLISVVKQSLILSAIVYPAAGAIAPDPVDWVVTSYRPEVSAIAPSFAAFDTGLNDGSFGQ